MKLQDFIVVNPVQNNQANNCKCSRLFVPAVTYKIRGLQTGHQQVTKQYKRYKGSFSIVYIPELGYTTCFYRYRHRHDIQISRYRVINKLQKITPVHRSDNDKRAQHSKGVMTYSKQTTCKVGKICYENNMHVYTYTLPLLGNG